MIECPECHRTERQNRTEKTDCGSQRYRCMFCQIKYTPEPKAWAYPEEMHQKAVQLYVDGMNLRRIARHLRVHHRRSLCGSKPMSTNYPIRRCPTKSKLKIAPTSPVTTLPRSFWKPVRVCEASEAERPKSSSITSICASIHPNRRACWYNSY